MLIGPKPSIIHVDAIKRSVANTAMANRTLLVQLWITGSHVKRLMDEHLMYPDEIAAHTGVPKAQLYSALTVREEFASVHDIPND